MPVKAILIDISDTIIVNGTSVPNAWAMLFQLQESVKNVYYVSNNLRGLTSNDSRLTFKSGNFLNPSVVKGKKGSGKFVKYVLRVHNLKPNEVLYVGDTEQDMWEAANGGVLFLRADWSNHRKKETKYGIDFSAPTRLSKAVTNWFVKDALWYFTLNKIDRLGRWVLYRSLIRYNVAADTGVTDLLKRGWDRKNVQKHLGGHLIASTSLEGLFFKDHEEKPPIICTYPSSKGTQTGALGKFVAYASQLANVDVRNDLILRHQHSEKEVWLRRNAKPVTLRNQLSTIILNSAYREEIIDRTVLVFDDFTTDGYGLETARNFLYNAGVGLVYCITAGKYKEGTYVFTPKEGVKWDSFRKCNLTDDDFTRKWVSGEIDLSTGDRFGSLT